MPGRTGAAILAALALLVSCSPPSTGDGPAVYAALSLREPLLSAGERLEGVAGSPITFNFGASNDLARQIIAARRADLFLSADEIQMDVVERAGLMEPGTRRTILSNALVIVVPMAEDPRRVARPADLAGPAVRRLSIADPSGVPVGRYARRWLERIGLWEEVRDRIVPAIDVRAALAAVESGGAQAGIVYRTDAALSRHVRVVHEVPFAEGPEISYSAALLRDGNAREGARRLLEYLDGEGAEEVFGPFGFIVK